MKSFERAANPPLDLAMKLPPDISADVECVLVLRAPQAGMLRDGDEETHRQGEEL